MKTHSMKQKGRRLQQRLARDIVTQLHLVPDDVTSRSMGAPGMDILLSPLARDVFPFAVEAKNQERLALWAAWKQTEANATGGLKPLLVVSRNHTEPLAILRWEDLLWLLSD